MKVLEFQNAAAWVERRLGDVCVDLDTTNLCNMRHFYQTFPIRETLSLELSWSHYCKIIRLENAAARDWYITETIDNEPQRNAVIQDFRITAADGKSYNTKHYKLAQLREISELRV
jgi:hypothetical protein